MVISMDQDTLRTNIAQLEEGIRILTEALSCLKKLLAEKERDVTVIMDMREFLQRFSAELPSEFRGHHVPLLIELMNRHGITRLVSDGRDGRGWFLASDGEFKNPLAKGPKQGNVEDLQRLPPAYGRVDQRGCVFDGQNPYFHSLHWAQNPQSG